MEPDILKIIDLCQRGDMGAFRIVVERHQDFAFNVAFKLLANEEDAKDIVQETFIRVWKNIERYNPKNKFTTWLYKIVVNLCLDHLKMKKRKNIQDSNNDNTQLDVGDGENMERQIIHKEMTDIINRLTEKLTPKQRIVFILFFIQERTIEEIREITSMSKGSIKSNLYYARKNMQLLVEKNEMITNSK